jgi:hypothetical protein
MDERAALLLFSLLTPTAAAQPIAIENVHVVTLEREKVLHDHAVMVDGGGIVSLMPMAGYTAAPGVQRIDGAGGWLMPGLVDTRVHIEEYMGARPEFGDAPVFLRHGITAIFNLRGFPEQLPLRDRIAPDQRADLVLLDADPLADIHAIAEPRAVMLRGRWLPRASIDGVNLIGPNRGLLPTTPSFRKVLEALMPGWLVCVNREGRRFVNEMGEYAVMSGASWRRPANRVSRFSTNGPAARRRRVHAMPMPSPCDHLPDLHGFAEERKFQRPSPLT